MTVCTVKHSESAPPSRPLVSCGHSETFTERLCGGTLGGGNTEMRPPPGTGRSREAVSPAYKAATEHRTVNVWEHSPMLGDQSC